MDKVKEQGSEAGTEARPHGLAERLGHKAFEHRDFMRSNGGDLMFRNALGSMIAWVPTVTSFAITRAFWEKYEQFAAKNAESVITKVAKPFLSKEYPVGRLITFIFFGWGTYRATTKLYHRAYDRLFAAKDSETAAQVVRDTPGNAIKDLKEIAPGGLAEVTVGAFVLGGVKAGLTNNATVAVPLKDWAAARKGYVNDWLATATGYSAFADVTERIYRGVNGDKDSPEYYRRLKGLPPEHHIPKDQKKFGFFTEDGVGRILFRTTGSVMLGFAAYFAAQRGVKAAIGVPTNLPVVEGVKTLEKTLGAITKNLAKDYAAWVPFTLYTVIAQVYKEGYDKLFNKLEAHYDRQGQNHGRS